MAVYEGTLKALSGGTHQGSTYHATADWVRLEFITIGDTRVRDVRMMNLHYELLKAEIDKEVALSLLAGGFNDQRKDQWTLVAARLSDGSVEKIPDEFSNTTVLGCAQMALMTLILLGAGVAGLVLNIQLLAIGGFVLGLLLAINIFRTRARASRIKSQILATIRAFDGSARSAAR